MKDVSIIIPAYNEARFIEKAILSAVPQAEFVIVSDNCSTDGTQEICKKLAKEFSNLIFYEQTKNLGSVKNGEFLYHQVQTDYVMTMGAHDILTENYVYELRKSLDENLDAVMAYAPAISIDDDDKILSETMLDDFASGFGSESPLTRVYTAITIEYNYAFFGLFRSNVFLKNADFTKEAGIDHLIMAKCAKNGKFVRCMDTRFYLRVPTRKESLEKYMERLAGNVCPVDMSYMCVNQLNILDALNDNSNVENNMLCNKARINLLGRYGKFCTKHAIFILNKLAQTNKKYILYGAGTNAQIIIPVLKDKIEFIIDRDPNKNGTKLDDISVYSIDKAYAYPDIPIIISQIGRFHTISYEITSDHKIDFSRLISLDVDKAIDYSYHIMKDTP